VKLIQDVNFVHVESSVCGNQGRCRVCGRLSRLF
jgi:hypothetical protein